MKKISFSILLLTITLIAFTQSSLKEMEPKRVQLPNGWSLTPVGKSLPLGDLPLNIAVSPTKKYLAITNNGESKHTLQLIDVQRQTVLHTVKILKAWYGLKFSADKEFLYASGGHD